jgi:hypothetical protein
VVELAPFESVCAVVDGPPDVLDELDAAPLLPSVPEPSPALSSLEHAASATTKPKPMLPPKTRISARIGESPRRSKTRPQAGEATTRKAGTRPASQSPSPGVAGLGTVLRAP